MSDASTRRTPAQKAVLAALQQHRAVCPGASPTISMPLCGSALHPARHIQFHNLALIASWGKVAIKRPPIGDIKNTCGPLKIAVGTVGQFVPKRKPCNAFGTNEFT
jgi:hypothetical protein